MTNKKPRVSIGLPVFNGEQFLRVALDSILSQTYQDFELIISDNASTDGTQQICYEYAWKDSRIRYYRNKTNLGASWNHNRVFKLSLGKYFKWAAYDDILAPDFLSRCVNVLDQNSSLVLCHSKTSRINECGKIIGEYNFGVRLGSLKKHERFGDIIGMRNEAWILLFGVIRSDSFRRTRLLGNYIGTDRNLLAELSLLGPMYAISDVLFFRREHLDAYTNKKHDSIREKLGWWTKTTAPKLIFPYLRICTEYFKSIRYEPLKWTERQRCYAQVVKWFFREGWFLMAFDLVYNIYGHQNINFILNPLVKLFVQLRERYARL